MDGIGKHKFELLRGVTIENSQSGLTVIRKEEGEIAKILLTNEESVMILAISSDKDLEPDENAMEIVGQQEAIEALELSIGSTYVCELFQVPTYIICVAKKREWK